IMAYGESRPGEGRGKHQSSAWSRRSSATTPMPIFFSIDIRLRPVRPSECSHARKGVDCNRRIHEATEWRKIFIRTFRHSVAQRHVECSPTADAVGYILPALRD